jgi:prepilin-type N-terminal cleavage/methylation domain-containing protein
MKKFTQNSISKLRNFKESKKKSAFTLAEILIAIGIIGIVAAITIPTLINGYQKKAMASKLKQTHAMLTNVIRMSEEENGTLTNDEIKSGVNLYSNDVKGFFKKYFVPYMSGVSYLKTTGVKTPANRQSLSIFSDSAYCLNNGTCFYFMNHSTAYYYIVVDLNGPSKPNKVGHDVFYFALHFNNKGAYLDGQVYNVNKNTTLSSLYDNGKQDGGSCNNYKSGWANGSACTEIIIRNGWKIPNDSRYPW